MIDLAAYDLRPLSERLRRIRTGRDFRERQALLEAVDSGALLETARPSPARPSQSARTPASGLPYTGPRAPSRGADEKLEDEWAMRRPGSGRGGGVAADPAPSARPGGGAAAPSSRPSGVSPAITAKAGLAAGAQAAVVKLASYGSGSARAASLLNYQSDKGQLTLEREDGTLVTGKAAVDDLAAHWRDDDARQPSNDVFRVTLTFEGGLAPEEARAGLEVALDGHRYAWRIEERADSALLHLVTVAAGARRDEYGKKERIYANEKSVDRFHDKLEDAFGRDVRSLGARLGAWRRGRDDPTCCAHQGRHASCGDRCRHKLGGRGRSPLLEAAEQREPPEAKESQPGARDRQDLASRHEIERPAGFRARDLEREARDRQRGFHGRRTGDARARV